MRLLVTGGAGFIGSHYVRTLLDGGYRGYEDAQVTVLDNLSYAASRTNLPERHPRMRFVEGDICSFPLLLELLPGHDAVVHFAAESHVDRSVESAVAFVRTNLTGTQTVLDACLKARIPRVVHISTDEVYGSIEQGSWTEDYPLLPNSPYAATKAGSDLLARSYWRTHGLNVSITRCSNNYGPHQHPEKLIPLFVTNLLEGERLPLYGDGRNVREWLHVDDHCRAVQMVLEGGRPGEVYNVGGGDELTNLELTEKLLHLCDADASRILRVADRKGHDFRYSLDETKIREELGYAPRVPFDTGLATTVNWYRANPGWWKTAKYRPEPNPEKDHA
ncbi:dTDP-glucose 4,6-dehydratase [Streptomyces sp. GMR22]|uniref:dTDP-glucose 4,6-dehydratase n=1 Tax=Streptomyces sp. GMR22 TaxID=2759524 RepID=UPI0015F7E26A|nr:dTDP-glucose 4,6-dehydratase [Streptomyces sp. GMR22]MBA6437034.1 dTDP-glucose 4,6-dehydratase [Streptomyces sp. GMR22]